MYGVNKKKNDEGFKPTWWLVLIALVIGLIVPDKMNPVVFILEKFGGDKPKQDAKTTTPATTAPKE